MSQQEVMDRQAVMDRVWATLDRMTARQDELEAQAAKRQAEQEAQAAKRQAEQEAQAAKQQAEQEAQAARSREEWDARFKSMAATLEATEKQMGKLGNRLGEFVETMVAPACETIFEERGIGVHEVSMNRSTRRHGRRMELDITVVDDDKMVVVEVKSKFEHADLTHFLGKLPEVTTFFPKYAGMRIIGAIAAMVMPERIIEEAMEAGLFVIIPSCDTVRLLNPVGFIPRAWDEMAHR